MSGIRDTATVTLNVNGVQAKQMMEELRKKIDSTRDSIETMKATAANPAEIEKARKQLVKYEKQLGEMQSAVEGVNSALTSLDTATTKQIKHAIKTLQKQLRDIPSGSEVWQEHAEKIKMLKMRLKELNAVMEPQESMWDRLSRKFFQVWPMIDLISDGYNMVAGQMRQFVDAFASMDQEMANVRKFTGMTAEQVAALNEEFKKIDTRTSREDLNRLAQEAGRLGKQSAEDVLGFVRAADKINVALDDLGEGATLTLSKLTGIFGDEQRYGTEQALLKVGSVINELSQNCSASAPYLAEFAQRMGGVGAQAKMTIPQIMGFAAVLDSNAQAMEASSTALQQVIVRMMQEPAKYAKVAGLDVKQFSDMLKRDVNGALIMFLDTLNKAGGMDVLSPMFKDMGETGSRAIAALSTLANNIDAVRQQQRAAAEAFREGTSVTKEFEVQNNTVQASLEKAQKSLNDLRVELGERLAPLARHFLTSASAITRALMVAIRFVDDNKAALISLAAGIAGYTIAANAAKVATAAWTLVGKIHTAMLVAQNTAYLAFTALIQLLTGHVGRAAVAWRSLNLAIKSNPIGLAVAAITTAIAAIWQWVEKTKAAREEERRLAEQRRQQVQEYRKEYGDISQASAEYAKAELDRLRSLYSATQDHTKSTKERIAAVKQLQKTYPQAFSNLTQEAILAGKASKEYRTLASNIILAARAEAAKKKIAENQGKLLDLQLEEEDINDAITSDSKKLDRARTLYERSAKAASVKNQNRLFTDGRWVKELQRQKDNIADLNANLDGNIDRLEKVRMQQDEIYSANERLAKLAASATMDIATNEPAATTTGGGGSVPLTDKESRKQEAEARREAAKAKAEFKQGLEAINSAKIAADVAVLKQYRDGSIDYEKLIEERHANEIHYYDLSLAYYKKHLAKIKDAQLEDDKDYQKLLLGRQSSEERFEKDIRAIKLEALKRNEDDAIESLEHEYEVQTDKSLSAEMKLQESIYQVKRNSLIEQQKLYAEGSKEYADLAYQIQKLETDKEMRDKKAYFKAVQSLREEYDKKSASEKYEMEKAALDALLKANIITAEQYARFLQGLRSKYAKDLPGSTSASGWGDADSKKYDADTAALKSALDTGLIAYEEYNRRLASLDAERREKMLSGLKSGSGEWNGYLANIYTSIKAFADSLNGTNEDVLQNLSNVVGSVSALIGGAMQLATSFAQAEAEIQIAALEKRYEREVQLAQGNSYKTKKLEKQKERETAKIKNDASKKQYEMQVIQAVAQSIQAGLNAYASTLAIPIVGPALAPAAMAVALAMGAVQVALLKKQQKAAEAQGYSRGGFTRKGRVDEPAGIVHAGEWVASQRLLASPVARPMIEALDYAQRTNTIGSLRADDVSRSIRATDSLSRIAEGDRGSALMVAAIAQYADVIASLNRRLSEPFVTVNTVTGDHGIKAAQDEYSRLIQNKSPKNRKNGTNS